MKRPQFVLGMPVQRSQSSFVQRTSTYHLIERALNSNRGVALIGPRRAGKTSFLLSLLKAPPEGFVPVYQDLSIFLPDEEKSFLALSSSLLKSFSSDMSLANFPKVGAYRSGNLS